MSSHPVKEPLSLYNLKRTDLEVTLSNWGYGSYHAGLIWKALYRQRVSSIAEMSSVKPEIRDLLARNTDLQPLFKVVEQRSSDGETKKFLFRLKDGQEIESVVMGYQGRTTICLSTQVGCSMGCVFCATGQMGYVRHLTAGEIVAQVIEVSRLSAGDEGQVRNIVFMGMGEPLHNFKNTMTSVDILTDDSGLAFGPRYITVSTIGLPKMIRKMADLDLGINLAVSLHAANDRDRSILVPLNRRWPLATLMAACRYYSENTGRRIFFEWALIGGKNDNVADAHELGDLLAGMQAHVNLIPLNHTRGFSALPTDDEGARIFQLTISEYGIPCTIRQRKGIDIDAGCGQLRAQHIK